MSAPPVAAIRRLLMPLALLGALAAVLAAGAPRADASVQVWDEPAYTKTNANNSYWWRWNAVTGGNENGTDNYTYYLCFRTLRGGQVVEDSNGTNGPSSQNCTGSLRNGPTPSSGDYGAYPFTGAGYVLDNGVNYTMCASGWRWYFYIWSHDNVSCEETVVDRSKPAITAFVNGTQTHTNNPNLQFHIDYVDSISPPWFGSNGRASNWICINRGGPCTPGSQPPDPNCSVPNVNNSRINSFDCAANVSAQPDGDWYFCAFSADAAVPDNPNGTNQFANAFSNNANLSNTSCGFVTLDRVAPQVSAQADNTTVTVGQLVNFSASASDPSGVSGSFAWDYGDNTQQGSGATTSHTYTQAGTYLVRATTTDNAGNSGSGTVTITVNPAPSGGGSGGGTGGGTGGTGGGTGGTGGGTGDTGGGTGGGTTTPGTSQGTTGATPMQQPVSDGNVSQTVGGGGTQDVDLGSLDIVAPKRLNLRRARAILLALTAESAGRVNVSLLRGSRIVARKGARLGGPGTYALRMRLPRKMRAGRYSLKVTFVPAGASRGRTKTLRLRATGARSSRASAASRPPASRLEGIPGGRGFEPVRGNPSRRVSVR